MPSSPLPHFLLVAGASACQCIGDFRCLGLGVWVDSFSSDCLAQPGHPSCWGACVLVFMAGHAAHPANSISSCWWKLWAGHLGVCIVATGGSSGTQCSFLEGRCSCPCGGALGSLCFGCLGSNFPHVCLGWVCCSPHMLVSILMEKPYIHKHAHTYTVVFIQVFSGTFIFGLRLPLNTSCIN